ncbi:uncharacterized protein LOC119958485 isoform X2 [Scyliorhinus canicula]|uniref:uncharacterized protein LOC119958485 isoform X2 n=1 Tax=Scyliorhinus canicula TaxID=7830 RepID=UPI0018F27E06|nr:uncharacterized protein LOC119958485 isoform X2 [Scyliorhinus canicula]
MEEATTGRPARHRRGVWTDTELRLLATALGELRRILDLGHFTVALNLTWNMKNADYNVAVIKKCIQLMDSGMISVNEICNARLAFFTYEQLYQKGMAIDKHTLMRALKMCSRVVAPEKLMHRIKHWKSTYTVKERIQLYEFMDLLLLSESVDHAIIKEERVPATGKTPRDLYKLEDTEYLRETHDERLARHLNKKFYQEERDYGKVTTDSIMLTEHPVLVKYRKQVEELHKNEYQWLKTSLQKCHEQLNQNKGRRLILPLPDLADCQKASQCSEWTEGTTSDSKRRVCTAKTWSATQQQEEEDMDDWVWVVSIPPLKSATYTTQSLSPIISAEELEEVQKKKDEMEYQMNTVKERTARELSWKIDYHLPGYKKLSASRQNADSSLMKPTSAVKPKVFEIQPFPMKSCCRSLSLSQAAKCSPAKLEKPARAPRPKDCKESLSQKKIQQPLCRQHDRNQVRAAYPQGLLPDSYTSPGVVSLPAITTKVMQSPVVTVKPEPTDNIAE